MRQELEPDSLDGVLEFPILPREARTAIPNDPALRNVQEFIKDNPENEHVKLYHAGQVGLGHFLYYGIGV